MVSVDSNNLQVHISTAAPSSQHPSPTRRYRPNFLMRFLQRRRSIRAENTRRRSHKKQRTSGRHAAPPNTVNTRPAVVQPPRRVVTPINTPPPQNQNRPPTSNGSVSMLSGDFDPQGNGGVTLGATLPPSFIQPGPAFNDVSPSTAYRHEVATAPNGNATANYVSSEQPEHTFWVHKNLEPALAVLEPHHAGRVQYTAGQTCLVHEALGDALVLPHFISQALPVYTEVEARHLFRQMVQIVQLMHEQHVVHRTLHLNHIVVTPEGRILLRGFQQAVLLQQQNNARYRSSAWFTDVPVTHAGRWDWYAFRAPELDELLRHGTPVDVWSLGACLSMMLTGLPPFRGTGRELKRQKQRGQTAPYDIVVPSQPAQDLVRRMVCAEPSERLTLEQVLEHEWMLGGDEYDEQVVDLTLAQVFLQDWGQKSR